MPVKLLITANDDALIGVLIERDLLATKLPEALLRKIKIVGYTHSHRILVRFHNNTQITFTLDEWLSDICIARIGLEAP